MILYLLYIVVIALIIEPIWKIISFDLMDENILFLVLTNYLLNIAVALFFLFFHNMLFSLISITLLSVFTILLTLRFKKIFGFYKLTSVPYLLYVLFMFTYILINFIQSI